MQDSNKAKQLASLQDAQYDLELNRKAREIYKAFAEKVAERNSDTNAMVNYSIHGLYSSVKTADREN